MQFHVEYRHRSSNCYHPDNCQWRNGQPVGRIGDSDIDTNVDSNSKAYAHSDVNAGTDANSDSETNAHSDVNTNTDTASNNRVYGNYS